MSSFENGARIATGQNAHTPRGRLYALLTIHPRPSPAPIGRSDVILWALASKQDKRFRTPADNTGIAFLAKS